VTQPFYGREVASLEVRWSGEPRVEVAVALQGLGLEEMDEGRYLVEGDGRTLVPVVDAVRDLETRVRSAGGELSVRFVDSSIAVV
jgi:hypothetical protein